MNRTFLSRLRVNGVSYLISGLLLLLVLPLYQVVILNPAGINNALNGGGAGHFSVYLTWMSQHRFQFIIYRLLLLLAFVLLCTLPFSLYRVIVAQEIMGQQERGETEEEQASDGMPAYAWRGRGFVVLAAWAGIISLIIYILATLTSTLYIVAVADKIKSNTAAPLLLGIFTISTNMIGIGLLGLSMLFFGAMICRNGLNLWPVHWIIFGYTAILVGGLLCISAIGVASVPGASNNTITTIAMLLFALWVCWLGLMFVCLTPER